MARPQRRGRRRRGAGRRQWFLHRATGHRTRSCPVQAEKASKLSELLTGLSYRRIRIAADATEPTVQSLLDIGATRIGRSSASARHPGRDVHRDRTDLLTDGSSGRAPLLQQALTIGRRAFGSDSVRAQSLNVSASSSATWQRGGRAAAARSLATRRRLLSSDTNDVAITLVELARVLRDRGRLPESEARSARRRFAPEYSATSTAKPQPARTSWGCCCWIARPRRR